MVNSILEAAPTATDTVHMTDHKYMPSIKRFVALGSKQVQHDEVCIPTVSDSEDLGIDKPPGTSLDSGVTELDIEDESAEMIRSQAMDLCGDVKVQYTKSVVGSGATKKTADDPPLVLDAWEAKKEISHAMEFTSHYNEQNEREKTTVTITSEALRSIIKDTMLTLLEHDNSALFDGPLPITVQTNNALVLHSWDRLWNATKNNPDSESSAELRCYLKNIASYEQAILQAHSSALREGQVDFDSMWTLFPPGSEVITMLFQNTYQIFTVDQHGPSSDGKGFKLSCWAYDWDGRALIRSAHEFIVQKFEGKKKVTELECYPLHFYKYGEEGPEWLRKQLIKRGKLFETFCKRDEGPQGASPTLWKCNNFAVTRPEQEVNVRHLLDWRSVMIRVGIEEVKSEKPAPVIIDPIQYAAYAPVVGESSLHVGTMVPRTRKPCQCKLCTMDGFRTAWDKQFAKGKGTASSEVVDLHLSNLLYSQLPPRLLGFVVDRKCWGQMLVEHTSVDRNDDTDRQSSTAWMELALEKEHKRNIEKMVTKHFKISESEALRLRIRDPVKDKGEGLVILLHGLPGLGKTMTAEGLAQTTKRRLIRIDATDFHYSAPSQVSQVFRKYFECAHRWGALLLLDEADVFLQSRKARDLAQNALVSVLLRELEYFKGVLIMTTNRIMTMDNAMESRIHYTVKFRDLDENCINQIFETFAKQLNEDNCREEDKQDILEFVKMEASDLVQKNLTGRDIRNILTTAQLLDWPYITHKNFRAILRNTGNFRQDMAARANAEHASNAAPRERNAY